MRFLLRELIQGARAWIRQPLFLLTAIAVLAIGLGANLTIFTIVDGLLLRPITPDHPDRLVAVYSRDTAEPDRYRTFSWPNYRDIAGAKTIFSDVLAHAPSLVGVAEGDVTRRAFADFVSANFFATLGAPLASGRAFTEAEAAAGSDVPVVIVSDALFNRLGRPADILSRQLRINGRDYAIVGVARATFTGTTALASPELWLPLGVYDRAVNDFARDAAPGPLADRASHALFLIARLQPGVALRDANRMLADLGARMAADDPVVNAHQTLLARPAPRLSISTRPPEETGVAIAAALLLSVATLVLVIACLNVATLLLSRGMARRREIAIRLALGATRGRIVRQLLVEGAAIASIACAVGLVAASRVTMLVASTIQAIAPLPIVFTSRPDARTIAAAVVWTALSTVVFALGPAWRLTRADVRDDLQRQPMFGRGTGWRRRASATNVLVVAQIALSLVLLTTAGLFLRGAARTLTAPFGFSLDGELVATIDPALGGYDAARGRQIDLGALDRIRSMPGVASASLASTTPFGDTREGTHIAAAPTTRRDRTRFAGFTVIGRDYFRTLGIALVAGREFTDAEERSAPSAGRVAIVDQLAAKRLWPGLDPIGRTLYTSTMDGDRTDALTVVGVAAPTRRDLIGDAEPEVYVPSGQAPRTMVTIHVKTAPSDEAGMLPAIRATLANVDPRLPILKLETLRTLRDDSPSMWMVTTSGRIFGTLGVLAAVLAVIGLYAVIAYVVSRRVKEIGIRVALGADRRDVVLLVLGDGIVLTAAGLTIGGLLSVGAVQAVRAVAASVASADAMVFAVPPVLLALAALGASLVPARRAAQLPPLVALREE